VLHSLVSVFCESVLCYLFSETVATQKQQHFMAVC